LERIQTVTSDKALLYAKAGAREHYAQPDYALVHQELSAKVCVILQLLWEEYEKAHVDSAYRYSQFCVRVCYARLLRLRTSRHFVWRRPAFAAAHPLH
jgi:hypothetical protein